MALFGDLPRKGKKKNLTNIFSIVIDFELLISLDKWLIACTKF